VVVLVLEGVPPCDRLGRDDERVDVGVGVVVREPADPAVVVLWPSEGFTDPSVLLPSGPLVPPALRELPVPADVVGRPVAPADRAGAPCEVPVGEASRPSAPPRAVPGEADVASDPEASTGVDGRPLVLVSTGGSGASDPPPHPQTARTATVQEARATLDVDLEPPCRLRRIAISAPTSNESCQ
jgi:hypothetical protein